MTKEKTGKKLETIFIKLKKAADFTAVIGVFYILLFQINLQVALSNPLKN